LVVALAMLNVLFVAPAMSFAVLYHR